MPEGESPPLPPEFNPDTPTLKRTAETAAQEGKIAAAGRQAGVVESQEETLEDIARMAEQQLEGHPSQQEIDAADQVRVSRVNTLRQEEKAEDKRGVIEAAQEIVNTPEAEEADAGSEFHSFSEASLKLGQELDRGVEVDPELEQWEHDVQKQLQLLDWHLARMEEKSMAPEIEAWVRRIRDWEKQIREAMMAYRAPFIEGHRLGDVGQADRAQKQAILNLKSVSGQLAQTLEGLGRMHGSGSSPEEK